MLPTEPLVKLKVWIVYQNTKNLSNWTLSMTQSSTWFETQTFNKLKSGKICKKWKNRTIKNLNYYLKPRTIIFQLPHPNLKALKKNYTSACLNVEQKCHRIKPVKLGTENLRNRIRFHLRIKNESMRFWGLWEMWIW